MNQQRPQYHFLGGFPPPDHLDKTNYIPQLIDCVLRLVSFNQTVSFHESGMNNLWKLDIANLSVIVDT